LVVVKLLPGCCPLAGEFAVVHTTPEAR